ncbi:MAG: SDR family NAD(P)-dependent oxidoreductase [Bacilli bacterium]|nr:SDR family NAD(P)-dependent oxidoreductase [Bacilli bacterium]
MKTILITGARSGIMHRVIKELLRKKYHIYVSVHTEKELERIQKKYQEELHVTCLKLDIQNKEDYKQLDLLDIDIYIANAAVGMGGSIINMDIDRIRENYETNVFSNLELLQYILNKMRERKTGKIILMASLAGILPVPFLGSYCSTKASLIKWAECLKLELLESKIPVSITLIEPGLYKTGFNRVMLENKYPEIETESYFNNIIEFLHLQDQIILGISRKNLASISNKICKAIDSKKPKFIYRAPLSEVIAAKFFQLFFE